MFSPLTDARFALAVETIYEGYLVHYGRPRLFAPGDQDTILLLGDYLYAQGLVRLSAAGSVAAVAEDRKSTRLNSSHSLLSRMPSSA